MKRILIYTTLVLLTFGCTPEEAVEIHKLTGDWTLSRFSQKLDNADYNYQNVSLYKSDSRYGGENTLIYLFGPDFETYDLALNNDFSFKRDIQFIGPDDITDTGKWTLIDDLDFIMDVDGSITPEEYLIVGTIGTDEFTFSESFLATPFTDAAYDTLEVKYPIDPDVEPDPDIRAANQLVWDEVEAKTPEVEIQWWWTVKKVVK